MDKTSIVVLIVTRSIPLANGLDALLKAIPQIDEVRVARNSENALKQIALRKPQIVLIDSFFLDDQPRALLEKIHGLSPDAQRVLLVDDLQKIGWVPQYAEAVWIKGGSPSAIATIVTNLLSTKGEEHEHNDSIS